MSCYESIDIRNLAIKAFCEVASRFDMSSGQCPPDRFCNMQEIFNKRLFELVEDYQLNHDSE